MIFLDSFLGFEYKFKFELLDYIERANTEEDFIEQTKDLICSLVGEKEYRTITSSLNENYLDFVVSELDKKGIKVTTYISNDYPRALYNVNCPPIVLYYK